MSRRNESRKRGTPPRKGPPPRGSVPPPAPPEVPEVAGGAPRAGWRGDVLVALAALATFSAGLRGGFVRSWDDGRFLLEFEPIRSISWAHFVEIVRQPHFEAYHPLHLLSYWIDVPIAGESALTMHVTNLVLWVHALFLGRRVLLALGLGPVAALIATLAFGLHPVQTEAVTWLTGRKESVALLFAGSAMLLHLRSPGPWSGAAWASRVLYVLAALAKTTVLPLPGVLFLADVLLRGRSRKDALVAQLPSLAAGAVLAYVVVVLWEANAMTREALPGLGSLALVGSTLSHHLSTALWPVATSPLYPIHRDASFALLEFWPLVPLALVAWRGGARGRFAALAFLVLALPVANIVPLYFEVQDRYLSLPLFALAFGLGALVDAMPSPWSRVVVLGYVAFFAVMTARYQPAWANDDALWAHATEAQPRAFYAWMKRGETLRDAAIEQLSAGDVDPEVARQRAVARLDESVAAYERAIELEPELVLAHVARMQALAHRDEISQRLPARDAVRFSQRFGARQADPDALRELAGEMVDAGYRDAALVPLGRALDLAPISFERLENAARVQLQNGNAWLARFYVSRLSGPSADPRLEMLREER
ncbi:MAG: tetratricopeptide repeat protein [Myxococcales bacterium]|nr:tetratricopeptide repeat protein [Myxococcales bacterium]